MLSLNATGQSSGTPPLHALTRRVDAEYRDMPGLTLTAAQAARLFGLERDACLEVLQALVASGRLHRTADGRYCAAGALQRVRRAHVSRR